VDFERRALRVTAFDPTVLAQRRPTPLKSVGQPDLVLDILCVVGEVFRRTVHMPAKLGKPFRHSTPEAAIQEELRRPG